MSSRHISIWKQSSNKLRQSEMLLEYLCIIGLLVAALILFLVNLGGLPLVDWDESINAQVAKEIYQATEDSWRWIFPTLWDSPYLAQPPLIHDLIAVAYALGGINELTTRLPGAILAIASVLLVYSIGREIFVARIPALLSALIYLTCLPVLRLGRMAMLDGPLLCFELLAIWAILRSRRDLRWALVAGIGFCLIGLTKGIFSLQVMAIALLFLFWDTPRLLGSVYLWLGIGLGIVPLLSWYVAQWYRYPQLFNPLVEQAVRQTSLESISPWSYLLLLIQYALPWFFIFLGGLQLARTNVHWSWGKLIVVWSGISVGILAIFFSEQPGYLLPLYPVLALAGGAKLDLIRNLPSYGNYPSNWSLGFALMSGMSAIATFYFGVYRYIDFYLPLMFLAVALTLGVTAIFISKKEIKFIVLLFWGLYVSLFILFNSSHWIWELELTESIAPLKSIAASIEDNVSSSKIIYTSADLNHPSLNFYSGRLVIPKTNAELKQSWLYSPSVSLLLDRKTLKQLNLPKNTIDRQIDSPSHEWTILIKK